LAATALVAAHQCTPSITEYTPGTFLTARRIAPAKRILSRPLEFIGGDEWDVAFFGGPTGAV
jgi:hypothetical protein